MLVRDRSIFELRTLGRLPRACVLVCVYVTVAFVFFVISRLRGTSTRRRKGEGAGGEEGEGLGWGYSLSLVSRVGSASRVFSLVKCSAFAVVKISVVG